MCITIRPIVSVSELYYVSEVNTDTLHNIQYIDLWISETSLSTLKILSKKLLAHRLILVLDGKVGGIFDDGFSESKIKFIRISARMNSSNQILWIFSNLKKIVKYQSLKEMMIDQKKNEK